MSDSDSATDHGESFEEFKRSFYYGTRGDLHFKFLASLPDDAAAEFFRELLEVLGDVFDTGEHDRVRELVDRWQVRAYAKDAQLREPPTLTDIPDDTPAEQLRVRHRGYDIRGARRDSETIFPLRTLHDLVEAGTVGRAASTHYGFVGAASQLQLRKHVAPEWAQRFEAAEVDACLLVAT